MTPNRRGEPRFAAPQNEFFELHSASLNGDAANIRKEGGEFGRAAASTLGPGMSNQVASFEVRLRTMIEEQPYTATAIALALGWLLGRTHRPL